MKKLVLYKKDVCPYCQKVMNFMDKNGIDSVEMKDIIEDPKNEEFLIKEGGLDQVPCLFIDGKAMYESDDIIEYLKESLLQGKDISESKDDQASDGMCPIF